MGTCAAESCTTVVSPEHLCCARHWRMVSKATQSEVYATWRRVKRDPEAYLEAKRAAIAEIAEREAAANNPNQGNLFR